MSRGVGDDGVSRTLSSSTPPRHSASKEARARSTSQRHPPLAVAVVLSQRRWGTLALDRSAQISGTPSAGGARRQACADEPWPAAPRRDLPMIKMLLLLHVPHEGQGRGQGPVVRNPSLCAAEGAPAGPAWGSWEAASSGSMSLVIDPAAIPRWIWCTGGQH